MSNYAQVADLLERFESDAALAHLTDTADTTGTYSTTRCQEAIDHAEGFLNSYVGQRYKIPVATTDAGIAAMFKSMTLDMAVYFLAARPGAEITDAMQALYDRTEAWLTKVSQGAIVVPSAATLATTASRDPLIEYGTAGETTDSKRVFSLHTMGSI